MSGGRSLGGMGGGGCCGTPGIPVALSRAVGPVGPQGIQGNPGPKGDTGSTGLPGNNGADGIDGLSAYQLAVAGGFTGSVNDWLLSLIGPQGQQGIAGPAGSQGAQGIAGPTGPTGPVGANGAQGPQGVQGATGAMGATGATGPQGIKGDQGIQGAPGAAGNGIASIVRTSGTGAPGTTDTYTITFTNATTATFTVYNGANGTGSIASVSATGPLASTGGSNPTISLVQDSNNRLVTDSEKAAWNAKQPAGSYSVVGHAHLTTDVTGLDSTLNAKQATLVSGTNIKTVGGANIVGSGNVDSFDINGGTIDGTVIGGSSAAAGSFTTLNASGLTKINGATNASNTLLGVKVATNAQLWVRPGTELGGGAGVGIQSSNDAGTGSTALTLHGSSICLGDNVPVTIPGSLSVSNRVSAVGVGFDLAGAGNWTNAAFKTSGAFSGGISWLDGSAGFVSWVQDYGAEWHLGYGTTSGTPTTAIKVANSGAVTIPGQTTIGGHLLFVTPEMFGAVGDGTTPDDTAFAAALNYAADNAVTLQLTKKEYLLTVAISRTMVQGQQLRIRGVGGVTKDNDPGGASDFGSRIRFRPASAATLLTLTAASVTTTSFDFADFVVSLAENNASPAAGFLYLTNIVSANYNNISNVQIADCMGIGIHVSTGCQRVQLYNCMIDQMTGSLYPVLKLSTSGTFTGDMIIENCNFTGTGTVNSTLVKVEASGTSDLAGLHFLNSVFYYCAYDLDFAVVNANSRVYDIFMNSCAFDGYTADTSQTLIALRLYGSGTFNNFMISNMYGVSWRTACVDINMAAGGKAKNIGIRDSYFGEIAFPPITMNATGASAVIEGVSVANNNFMNCGANGTAVVYFGGNSGGAVSGISVVGNTHTWVAGAPGGYTTKPANFISAPVGTEDIAAVANVGVCTSAVLSTTAVGKQDVGNIKRT